MSRPFRVAPPDVADALLRPAVLRRLLARFEARVMVVRAGAGFGKTTALTQAIEQNTLAPRGRDLWLGCEPADREADHLRAGLNQVVGLGPGADLDAITDRVAAESPAQVCIVLDDIHEIETGSTGARLLTRLVADLPSNGHVLLSTRNEPPLNLARLEAQGRVARLGEAELALDRAELTKLARRAGRATDTVEHLGGWPALVALGLRSGPVRDFLDQEVIASLDDDQRRLLAIVVALGGADTALLTALTGIEAEPALGELPMLHHRDGWYEAHALWTELFPPAAIAEARHDHQRDAVHHLLAHGRGARAVELACRTGQSDLVVAALGVTVLTGDVEDIDSLVRWRDMLPDDVRRHPVAHHLDGLIEQATDPTTQRCLELFRRAADGFEALGDLDALVTATAEIGFWHHIQRDPAGLVEVAATMQELADRGVAAAVPYVELTQAFVGLAQGDPHAMLAALRRARASPMTGRFRAVADWLEFQAREFLGDTDVALADRYLVGAGAIRGTEVIAVSARWRAGRVEELLADPTAWEARTGSERARFLSHAWMAAVTAGTGRLDDARRHLRLAQRLAGERGAQQVEITLGLPEMLIEYEAGNLARAEAMLRELTERIPVAGNTRLSYNGSAAMLTRYAPAALDELPVPMPARDVALGAALREVDSTGELTAVAALEWPATTGMLLSSLFLRAACELVCAAWAVGRDEAGPAAEWLLDVVGDPARQRFRDHCDHPVEELARAAREIVAAVPMPPASVTRLHLLGPERLQIGDVDTGHEDWRRERVRSLLGFLVVHPDATRDAVMAALWPDAAEDAARRNLRSTLNLLLGVLEPGRSGGDASYFVRADATRIRLAGHDRLDVDVWRFDSLLDEAAQLEADGAPSLALDCLTEAVALYRGELLTGVAEGNWLDLERRRLHVRFIGAGVRGAELLLAHDRVDEAIDLSNRTITAEPWSEPAHRALVAAHLQRGDRAAAHRAMQRCHEVLAELGGPAEELTTMLERRLTGSS